MKKKILLIALAVIAAAGISVGIVALAGGFSSKDNSSSLSQSSPLGSSSSNSANDQPEIFKIDIDPVFDKVNENFSSVTLKDVYLIADGEYSGLYKIMNDVRVGDLAQTILSSFIDVGYYSDGNWYIAKDGELTRLNKVTCAIFDYDVGSKQALALSEADIRIYGSKTVVSFIESDLKISFSEVLPLLPDGIENIFSRTFELTVSDLYDISNGDYTFVDQFIKETDIDEITNFVIDVMEFSGENKYTEIRTALNNVLNGKLVSIEVNKSASVLSLINAYFSTQPSDDLTIVMAKAELMKWYNGVNIGDFITVTKTFDVDKVITSIVTVLTIDSTNVEPEEITRIQEWGNNLKDLLDCNLGELVINQDANFYKIIKDFMDENEVQDSHEKATRYSNLIIYYYEAVEYLEQANSLLNQSINNYLITFFECDKTNAEAVAFIDELSNAIASFVKGDLHSIRQFLDDNKSLTMDTVDGYLNGYISDCALSLGFEDTEFLKNLTVGDLHLIICDVIDKSTISIEELFDAIALANGQISQIVEEIKIALEEIIESNKDRTLEEIFGDKIPFNSLFDNVTIGDLFLPTEINSSNHSLKISTIDDILLEGLLYQTLKDTGLEALLNLTVDEYKTIFNLQASENTLNTLDGIKLIDLLNFIEKNLSQEQA